jgi:hypothetical protein
LREDLILYLGGYADALHLLFEVGACGVRHGRVGKDPDGRVESGGSDVRVCVGEEWQEEGREWSERREARRVARMWTACSLARAFLLAKPFSFNPASIRVQGAVAEEASECS